MPIVEPIIREMLGQPAASYAPEKIFSLGKFVINEYRTIAEKLIMSAARFKMQFSGKYLPKLPIDGVEDDLDSIIELDENQLGTESGDSDCSGDEFDNQSSDNSDNEM